MPNRLKTITALRRRICALVVLWFFIAIQPLWAGLNVTVTGCPCTAGNYPSIVFNVCNNTSFTYQVTGVQFQDPSVNIPIGSFYNSAPVTVLSSTAPYAYQVWLANTVQVFPTGYCDSSDLSAYEGNTGANNGTPYNVQVMLKTGSCSEPPLPVTPTPIAYTSCATMDTALTNLTSQASYYSTTCVPWTDNGGANGGGFVNTFLNQTTKVAMTQIQIGYSNTPIAINGTCTFNPTSMGGPQYMMAIAAGQEYFNMDMINMLGIGARENAAALQGGDYFVGDAGNECPAVGVGGVFNVESPTFLRDIQGFPELYPQYSACVASYTSVAAAEAGCPAIGTQGETALEFYTHTANFNPMATGTCLSGDSAQMINSVVLAGSDLWFIYDLVGQANGLCFSEQLQQGHDPYAAIKIIDGAYNGGVNATIVNGILPPSASSLASTNLTPPNGAYTDAIVNFITQVTADSSCDGATIYDAPISWNEVQTFFFGNGPGTPATQGDGGLLLHFNLTTAQRTSLYNDLQCAFNYLSQHWSPYTSNGGTAYVSYRYDWLTMMRVAQNYLNTSLPIPTSTEFNQDLANFPGWTVSNPTCPGVTNETTYPSMTITSPATGMALNSPVTVCPPFNLTMTATDSSAVSLAQWTLDPTWNTWTNFAAPSGSTYTASLTSSTSGMPASGAVTAWVMVGNPCYNNVVQAVYLYVQCSAATPTPTMTNTATATKTNTQTPTPSSTSTATPTATNSATSTASFTSTATVSNTMTATTSPTSTSTVTPSPTQTSTATTLNTFTDTLTPTVTSTFTVTPTGTEPPTNTYTSTETALNTSTATITSSATNTPVDTYTWTTTQTSTATLMDTATMTVTSTSTATLADSATSTPTLVDTATMTVTSTSTATLADSATSTPTLVNTATGTMSPTSTSTLVNTATTTPTLTSTATAVFTPTNTPVMGNAPFVGKNVFFPPGDQLPINVTVRDAPGNYGLYIFNSAGEHIKTLDEKTLSGPYSNSYMWDGTNKYGAHCASGIYIIYLVEPLKTVKARVVLIR